MPKIFRVDGWEPELSKSGFRPDEDVPDAFYRSQGAFGQLIKRSQMVRDRQDSVIELNVLYRFEGMDVDAIILHSQLRRKGSPVSFDFGGGDEWKPGHEESALAALIHFGIPWLEEYSRPEKLIEYYERCLRDGIPKRSWKLPFPFKSVVIEQGPRADSNVRRPPAYHEYLAYLYRDIGDANASRQHAHRYLETIPDNEYWTEDRGKIKRLIDSLGNDV